MRIQAVVELVEDGAAAVVVVLGLLPRPHRPRHGHGLAPERAARPLQRALDGVDHWKHMVSPELFASADKYPRQEILHNIDLWSLDTQFHNVSLLVETPVAGDDAEALSLSRR